MKTLEQIFRQHPALLDTSYEDYKKVLVAAAFGGDKEFANVIVDLLKHKKEEVEAAKKTWRKTHEEK